MPENGAELPRPRDKKERLQDVGLTIKPIDMDDVTMVNSRDLDGGDYPYIGLLSSKFKRGINTIGLFADNQLVGYAISGLYEREGRLTGEVGMQHISPSVRDLGLGSLLNLIARKEMLEQRPDALYSEIGDSSGKVEHILSTLGFQQTGVSSGVGRHPVWERQITSDADREALAAQIDQSIEARLEALKDKRQFLADKAQAVDKDNPDKVDIEQVVNERLGRNDMLSPKESLTFFGYVGAKVRLARSIRNQGIGYSIMLDIKDADKAQLEELLKQTGQESGYRVEPMHSWVKKRDIGVRVSSSFSHDATKLQGNVRTLAHLAEQLHPNQ